MGPEHFEHLKALWRDPSVAEFTCLTPMDEEQAWNTLAASVGHWSMRGYGMFCAFEKVSGEFIGTMGLWNPPTRPEPEFTCLLRPKYWGGRYGVEGGRRFIELVQRELGWSTLACVIRKGNEKSVRGLVRLGAKYERDVRLAQSEWQLYRLFQVSEPLHAYGPGQQGRQPNAS
jgi:RimJ/RimL family protein N-acetyltransferase